jgi:hypothetical protein
MGPAPRKRRPDIESSDSRGRVPNTGTRPRRLRGRTSIRKILIAALLATLSGFPLPAGAGNLVATLYKNPGCECCESYADYLRQGGIEVEVIASDRLDEVKRQQGVPAALESCHTMTIDGYVIEGHVPLGAITRLLAERPAITGIALPGMPPGSPGMGGTRQGPFQILSFGKGEPALFGLE